MNISRFALVGCALAGALAGSAWARSSVTSPKQFFGFAIGDDYKLANYRQYSEYLRRLDAESDRITVVSIGKTEEGREQLMAVISSPENLRRLNRFKDISRKLTLGEARGADEAKRLAAEGRAIVWIDGGLHATEVLGAQQLIETVYRLVSSEDAETMRIRNDVVTLVAHANPDGMDLVSDWYMRREVPEQRSLTGLPRLYQKYVGHDNNRDFYACNMAESTNINRVLYREWFPQIVYNHHQTAPAGSIIFAPPFRGPFNYHVDPLAQVQTDFVGMAMHARFIAEGKPGAVMRNAASYQTWWNGGLRTTTYFHNMVGILTEAFGSPTPSRVAFVPNKLVPNPDVPLPVEPQEWKFAQSIEYELTANYAILDYASRYREALLFNSWQMARNAMTKGFKDTWTHYPSRVEANGRGDFAALKAPQLRDAKAYVIPADQPDFPTAAKFANMLMKNGVAVHRATTPLSVGGRTYPQGSLIVRCDQAFRAHVLDMFEPQDYPNDFQYPGGPPIPPYDSAGYTPAFTMGVRFDRILDRFETPIEKVDGLVSVVGRLAPAGSQDAMAVLDGRANDSYAAAAKLLAAGVPVFRMTGGDPTAGPSADVGSFLVPASATDVIAKVALPLGLEVRSLARLPSAGATPVAAARIALLDRYGGSMPSGWTRWILEQFGFAFTVIYPPDIDRGGLRERFDTLILVDGMTFGGGGQGGGESGEGREGPEAETGLQGRGQGGLQNDPTIPEEWRARMGGLSLETSLPNVKAFLEAGGTVVAIGSATNIGRQLGLPIASHLTETVAGQERPLGRTKFYCPGSVLRVRVDASHPAAMGVSPDLDVMFDSSPVFKLLEGAESRGIRAIATFDSEKPLRSGWCWGQQFLKGGVAALEAPVGKGRLLLYGPEILFRGQTHASFKLLFNALFLPER